MVLLRYLSLTFFTGYFLLASYNLLQLVGRANVQGGEAMPWVLLLALVGAGGGVLYRARRSGHPRALTVTAFLLSLLPALLVILVFILMATSGVTC